MTDAQKKNYKEEIKAATQFHEEQMSGNIWKWYYSECPFCGVENTFAIAHTQQCKSWLLSTDDVGSVCMHFNDYFVIDGQISADFIKE